MEELLKAGDPASLKYFLVFFRAESFQPGGFLDRVLTQSVEYAQRVGAELKENVYEALRYLCQGFLGGNAELSVFSLSGGYVETVEFNSVGSGEATLAYPGASSLSSGTYFFRFSQGGRVEAGSFTVVR